MNDVDPFVRAHTHAVMMRARLAWLIGLSRGDEKLTAEAERNVAVCQNMIAELDAIGKDRKFSSGQIVTLKAPSATTSDQGVVAGWASTSDQDLYGHRIQRGAFSASIARRGLTGASAIKLLLDHDWKKPAGLITELSYRGENLWVESQMALDVGYVNDRYKIMKLLNGFNFSVGFVLEDYEIKTDPVTRQEYLQINKGDLFEVSIVAFPGNENATAHEVRSLSDEERMEAMIATMREMKRTLA